MPAALCQSGVVATLEPFRGFRYDPDGRDGLDRVIAPPYDVVGPEARALLAARSPFNAVHVELPEPDVATGADRYVAAAAKLRDWTASGALVREGAPALYPYRTTTPDGRSSLGVIGALHIGPDVLPHEQTLPKPRSDRLDLQRATSANLSPIWALSLTLGLTDRFTPDGPPAADVTDDDGVRHQLWVVTDPAVLAAVRAGVARSPLVIADGHHRYETAANYRRERRAAGDDRPGPYDAVMALVVELAEEQLSVGAIHRVVHGLPEGTDLRGALAEHFDLVPAGPLDEATVGSLARSGNGALLTPEGAWRLDRKGTEPAELDAALVDRSLEGAGAAECSYEGSWPAVVTALERGDADAAVLLRPVTVSQIAEWAAAGRRMPPKTTYFTPKPRSGLLYRLLDGS